MAEIDSHAEFIDLEITSDPNAVQRQTQPLLPNPDLQPVVDITSRLPK